MSADRSSPKKEFYPLLALFRAILAVLVVLQHFGSGILYKLPGDMPEGVRTFPRMAAFFMMSGFLLAFLSLKRSNSDKVPLKPFFKRRIARIYPLYLFALLISVPQVAFHLLQATHSYSPGYLATFFASKLLLLQSWYAPFATDPPFLYAAWTLSCEAFFYVCFPILLHLAFGQGKKVLAVATIALLAVSSYTNLLPLNVETPFWSNWSPIARLPEFSAGVTLAVLTYRTGDRWNKIREHISWLSPILALAACSFGSQAQKPGVYYFSLLCVAALLWSWMKPAPALERLFPEKGVAYAGDLSYALFLMHGPIYGYLTKSKVFDTVWVFYTAWGFLAYFAITLVVSVAVHHWVELPLRKLVEGKKASKPKIQTSSA